MDKNMIGMGSTLLSGILFAGRYVAAGAYMAGSAEKSRAIFKAGLDYTGKELMALSVVTLLIGVAFYIWAEIERRGDR